MDYDDNEFASRNTQLVGEEDSKFPPGLRSYALPKFDLDEHLQVHLRFDSLGETGILLGISNQTEEHWIEDYSREDRNILVLDPVSQGLDFGVSAEESCTISRSNNVWSEAASSESVEMLLNSVGQDEMTTDKGDTAKTDAPDTLANLDQQMNSGLCPTGSSSNARNVSSADTTMPIDSCLQSLSSSGKDPVGNMSHVEVIPECHGDMSECQSLGNQDQMANDLHESSSSRPSAFLERISTAVESSQDNVNELLSGDKKQPKDEHLIGLVPQQAENKLQNEGPIEGDSVVDDTVHCISDFSTEATSEKLVTKKADYPAAQLDIGGGAILPRDTCNELFCQELQGSPVTDNAIATDSKILDKNVERNDRPVEHKFVDNKCEQLSETCCMVVTNRSLEQTMSASNLAEDLQNLSQSTDFCSMEVHETNAVIVDCLDPTSSQKEVSASLADSRMADLTSVNKTSEVLMDHGPVSCGMEDHGMEDIDSSGSSAKDASQQLSGNGAPDQTTVLGNDTLASSVLGSSNADEGSPLGDMPVRHPQEQAEDTVQNKLVQSETVTSKNIVYRCLPSEGLTAISHQVIPLKNGVFSGNKSDTAAVNNLEGTVSQTVTEDTTMSSKENVEQKEDTLDFSGSGETGNRELIASVSLRDEFNNRECQTISTCNLASDTKEHVVHIVGAESHALAIGHSSAPVQPSDDNVILSRLQASGVGKGAYGDSTEIEKISVSSPLLDKENDPPMVTEVSAKGSKFSVVSVTDEEAGEEKQPMPPIVSAVGSVGTLCDNKHQINEKTPCEDPPSTEVCPETPSGIMKAPPASSSVEVLNYVQGVSYDRDCLKNDVDASKADNTDNDVNSVEPDCGSPTVISCSEPCVSDKAQHEGEKQSLVQNCPTSGGASCAPADVSVHTDIPKGTDKTSQTPGRSDVMENDESFTFKVGKLLSPCVNEKNKEGCTSFPSVQPSESFQADHKRSSERASRRNRTPNEKKMIEPGKNPTTGKSRSRSGSRTEIASGKGKPAKEPLSTRLISSNTREGKNLPDTLASPGGTLLSTQIRVEEGKKLAYIEGSATKSYSIKAAQTSNLSDFTTYASPTSGLFQQPFTDMQQLQLRAQIFVYGFLIQGTAPDEACMVSAFGESGGDGGRSMWESAWHLAVERSRGQKSWANPEVSPVANTGIKTNERTPKGNSVQGKSSIVSAGRAAGKGSSVSHPSPAVSMPSPTWTMATSSRDVAQANTVTRTSPVDPHTTLTPVHVLYPSPHVRPVAGHPTTWPSHVPSPVPWIFPHQASTMDGTSYATFPTPETVHANSLRDHPVAASVNVTSISQPSVSSPFPTAMSSAVASAGIHTEVLPANASGSTSGMPPSTVSKPRKRKKNVPSENNSLPYVHPFPTELGSTAVIPTKQILVSTSASTPTTFSFTSAVSASRATCGEPTSNPSLALSNYQVISGNNPEQRAIFSKEACSPVEQAKRQAEDAAAVSASAVRHSQDIWSQLAVKRNSGLVSDVEETLASAAVAAAAAASVAKAAAAAAKVAADATLQAKLMVDEALTMNKVFTGVCGTEPNTSIGTGSSIYTSSSLNGKVKQGSSSSVLEFAREAARKRVEAASAATKRAQNLDAVVKAAELAAEAITQATAIVAMGDPIPMTLTELLEAGPGGCWKDQDISSLFTKKSKTIEILQLSKGASIEPNNSLSLKSSLKKNDMCGSEERNRNASKNSSKQSSENKRELINGTHDAVPIVEATEINQKKQRLSQSINIVGSIPSSEHLSGNASMSMHLEDFGKDGLSEASNGKSIKQGSLVEVISDEEGHRAVWFSAKVLEVKDGKAYVCYNELLSDEGPGQLKEWIPLELDDGKPPRIRVAHPMTAMKFEGTRKRRRAAMGNYNWSAGDHVDAWIRDGWREGIITEKSKEDESKLAVHFPAEGDIRTVRAWDIRPSLVWKDGQWVEWSRDRGCWLNEQGDTPLDKRQKLDRNLENDSSLDKGQENPSKIAYSGSSTKPQELKELGFPSTDTLFSIGKGTADNDKLASGRIKRTGLQKEGSRVVFGVPKPGKKRKFMDVSKHYGAEQVVKVDHTNNMAKFSKYLMPQKTSGWANASKDDPKGGRTSTANTWTKDVLGKLREGQSKSRSRKVVQPVSCLPPSSGTIENDQLRGPPCLTHEENPEKQNQAEIVSAFGSDLLPHGKGFSAVDSRVARKGKAAAAAERSSSGEGKLEPDLGEPRRSHRRIQPTSRLLEGLQSSLTIGKVSSSAVHEKGSKALTRSVNSSVKGNGHGLQK